MFDGIDPEYKTYSNEHHLAEMVAYLGPPPADFLCRSPASLEFFDDNGEFILILDYTVAETKTDGCPSQRKLERAS